MSMDLYYSPLSPPSRAVLVIAKYLSIEFNLKEVDLLKGEQLSDEFIKLNPTHKVPVLVDGDFVLWESRAIMRYLCNKYAPDSTLYPSDPQKRASVDKMLDFDTDLFHAIHEVIINQYHGKDPTEQQMDNYHKTLKLIDGLVTDRKFVADDELTIADISVAHTISMLGFSDFKDTEDYPNMMAWYNGLKEESNHFKESCETARVNFEKFTAEKQKAA